MINPKGMNYSQFFIICAEDEGKPLFLYKTSFGRSAMRMDLRNALREYPIAYVTKEIKHVEKIAEEIIKERNS